MTENLCCPIVDIFLDVDPKTFFTLFCIMKTVLFWYYFKSFVANATIFFK